MMYEVQIIVGYNAKGYKKIAFRKIHESRLSEYIRYCQFIHHYIISVSRLYPMYPKAVVDQMVRSVRGIHIDEDETRL